MSRIVVAAFEPFGGRRRNRSWEAVSRLPPLPGVETVRLPVDFEAIGGAVRRILEGAPTALLLVGEAPGRHLRVEGVALNVGDSDRPDNAGARPAGRPLVPDGALALLARWDPVEVARGVAATGVRVRPSFHAGTYLCNAALYHALAGAPEGTPVGFLHVPRRGWPWGPRLGALARAVEVVLRELLGANSNFASQST